MKSKEVKRGEKSPQTLKAYIDYQTEVYTDELCELEMRLHEGLFEEEDLPILHDTRIEYIAKLNVLKSIKIICNERGRYWLNLK